MKLFKSILMAAGFVGLLAACNNIDTPQQQKDSAPNFVINVNTRMATKATTDVLSGEETIKDLQIYIFKQSDMSLYRYKDTVLTASANKTTFRIEENLNANEDYYVAVFANGLSANPVCRHQGFQNINDLRAQVVRLASTTPGPTGPWTMYGETDGQNGSSQAIHVNVGQTAQVNVTVTRFVSRIRLMSVQNKIPEAYGAISIDKVFVINAYSKWNMAGTGTVATSAIGGQFNWGGVGAVSAAIIASAGDCVYVEDNVTYPYGAHTYNAPAQSIPNFYKLQTDGDPAPAVGSTWNATANNEQGIPFYVFPNNKADDHNSDSFRGAISLSTAACTRLVFYASFTNNGQTARYYYPVTIPAMERNKSYDVNLIISGFGSDHPNKEPEKGSMQVNVTVKDWEEGQVINQEY